MVDPLVLLLDEPTSGLDSTTAVSLLQLLHRLARGDGANETPKTVITSIHQRTFTWRHIFDRFKSGTYLTLVSRSFSHKYWSQPAQLFFGLLISCSCFPMGKSYTLEVL